MKITKPEQLTYFIVRDDEQYEVKAYGSVDTNQEMVTPHPIVDQYTDEAEWFAKLAEAGITIEENLEPA
jgi:hypothetical protein